jgi:hypothetical protein
MRVREEQECHRAVVCMQVRSSTARLSRKVNIGTMELAKESRSLGETAPAGGRSGMGSCRYVILYGVTRTFVSGIKEGTSGCDSPCSG